MHLEACYRFRWTLDEAKATDLQELRLLLWYAQQRDRIRAEQQSQTTR